MTTLSPESYELLKCFNNGLTVHNSSLFNETSIYQLSENGFIESHIVDYDLFGEIPEPKFSDYVITEKGKGYIAYREYEEAFHSSVKEIADSAKTQAQIAKAKSEKADIKSWIAIGISLFAVLIDFVVNYDAIIAFLQKFI